MGTNHRAGTAKGLNTPNLPWSRPTDIISAVKISDVYRALGGGELHHERGRAFWRDGQGFNVSLNDKRGVWHDFATGDGGGVLDLVQRARGTTKADALRWLADFAGVPLKDRAWSPQERARFAQERTVFERDLAEARDWRRAGMMLCEEALDLLKSALFDPTAGRVDTGELMDVERLLARLRSAGDAGLVDEYREWRTARPKITAAMIWAARRRGEIERRALERFIKELAFEVAA